MLLQAGLGLIVGIVSTIAGIGGGFVFVPVFMLVFHWTAQQAVGTSLAIIFLGSLSGAVAYIRQRLVYWDAGLRFSLATMPGAVVGSYFTGYFSGAAFRLTFGCLVLLLSAVVFYKARQKQRQRQDLPAGFVYNRRLGVGLSVIVGLISSLFGIGGGIIHVPVMVYLLKFPVHTAVATSAFILAVTTFFGALTHYSYGAIAMLPVLTIGGGAIVGAQLGARLAARFNSGALQQILAWAMVLLGCRLILL